MEEGPVNLQFYSRGELKDKEWNKDTKWWSHPKVDRETMQELNRRSNLEGGLRAMMHLILIAGTA